MELRGDMIAQAQEDVKAHAEANAIESNIQKVVDKKTKDLQVCITYTWLTLESTKHWQLLWPIIPTIVCTFSQTRTRGTRIPHSRPLGMFVWAVLGLKRFVKPCKIAKNVSFGVLQSLRSAICKLIAYYPGAAGQR